MPKLRKFLCACFGFASWMYGIVAFGTVGHLGRTLHAPSPGPYHPLPWPAVVGLLSLSSLIRLAPLVTAGLCAAAWFTLRSEKSSGKRWAIAASTAMLTLDAVLAIGLVIIWAYTRNQASTGFGEFVLLTMALIWLPQAAFGVSGLVAFWGNDPEIQSQCARRRPPRISGDGTSPLLDAISAVVGLAGFIAGVRYWERWGWSHHLQGYRHGFPLTLIILGMLIATALHETGHATAGVAMGMKLRAFIVGPFQWRIRDGKWRFQFTLTKLFAGGGATALVPTDPNQSQGQEVVMIAAGPVTELLFGLAALGFLLSARGRPYEPIWGLLAVIVTISIIGFVGNLIPVNPEGLYSDGARIYQLLKGGAWADFHRATTLAASTTVTSLRPRDYDIEAVKRAEQLFTRGIRAVVLRLLESSYYLDCGKRDEASRAVTEAEVICRETGIDAPPELRVALVFRIAFLRHDAPSARFWWGTIEAAQAIHRGSDYWLAKSALLLSEGQMDEAQDAWNNAHDLVSKLPTMGDYEFDRYRCELLGQAINSTSRSPSQPAVASAV